MFLAYFVQSSRGRAVAANHIPPTQGVTVTSCIMRKIPYATPAFHLFHMCGLEAEQGSTVVLKSEF